MNRLHTLLSRVAAVAATVSMATAGVAISAAPAQAAPGDLTCVVDLIDVNFAPPLSPTNLETDATGGGPLILCVSPNGQFSNLTGASITGTGKAKLIPPTLGALPSATVKGSAQFVWNNNQGTSTFEFEVNTNPLTPKFEAKITDGPLTGRTSVPTGPVLFLPKTEIGCLFTCMSGFTAAAITVSFA